MARKNTTSAVKGDKGTSEKRTRKSAAEARAEKSAELRAYAYAGVGVMSVLSAVLNGYANAQHSPSAVAGWFMGITIPVIILILCKVGGLLFKADHKALAYVTFAAGASLLLLSVWHCSTSIALLTGSSVALALPMALAIDVGFSACELALIAAK